MRTSILLALALALPAVARAQAPVVTPAGDPSVRDDSIYALVVPPEEHRDEDFVYLLDDGIVRLEADGRARTTYRQVIEILNRDAAENWGELSFGYSPARERLTVNWVRVLSLDGHVLSDRPAHEQESRSSVASTAPVYTDRMVRRLSLGAVAPGTIVDYSYTVEIVDPLIPGDHLTSWSVTTGRLTRRSRYILDVPDSVPLVIKEDNWHGPRPETRRGGRRTYLWAARDLPKLEGEPFAAEPNSVDVGVQTVLPRTWDAVAADYGRLSRGRFDVDSTLAARLAEVVADARSLEDSVRAVHRWVAQDFRYVSLSLGLGGYQPRTPEEVLQTQYGDCKDKATLFVALLRRMGVPAWPVLLSQSASADSTMPTFRQFDHMIAAVELPGRPGYTYVDLTADLTPFGELPLSEQGGFALVLKDGGRGEHVLLPEAPITDNVTVLRVEGALDTAGMFEGRFIRTGAGARQYTLRELFAEPQSVRERDDFMRSLAASLFEDATGDSLQSFDGRDLRASVRMSMAVHNGRAVRHSGGIDILRVPIDNFGTTRLANDLSARGPRRFPIDVSAVSGLGDLELEFAVTLPEGWRARLPENVVAASRFGSYRAEYVQDGRTVRVTRRLTGARGTEPPERVGELIEWIRAIARDDVPYLVLEHPSR